MNNNLLQPNEAIVSGIIVDGNPAVIEKDDFNPKGQFRVEIGVTVGSKSAERVNSAMRVAMDHGHKYTFDRYCLLEPKLPCYDGDSEELRKPLAKGQLVVRTKSSSMPLLIGLDGNESIDRNDWIPGTKVKALISFFPYHVNSNDGVSATIKFMGLVEKVETMSMADRANALFAAYGDDE